MGNIGIYVDGIAATADGKTLSAENFVHRHELAKLYFVTSEREIVDTIIPTESVCAEYCDDGLLLQLLAAARNEVIDGCIYLSVPLQHIPVLLQQSNIKRMFLCDANGCCSAENLLRMILLGCGEDYLPQEALQACPKAYGAECRRLPLEELKHTVMALYDAKRIPHAIGCCEMAVKLAEHYGADTEKAARAGILHDITKILTVPEQLRLCKKYAIMTDDYCGQMSKLLHAKTAAAVAEQVFGESEDVCDAISWHTTGKADMTLLSKIIYIADYIEQNRKFDGVEELRKLAFDDLDAAVLCGIQMTIDTLTANNRPLNRYTLEARDFLRPEGNI